MMDAWAMALSSQLELEEMHLQFIGDKAGVDSSARCANCAAKLVCQVVQHAEPILALQAPPA